MRKLLGTILLSLLFLFCYIHNSYAWVATGHTLTSYAASEMLTDQTLVQVNRLLQAKINFPATEAKPGVFPTSVVELAATFSNMPSAPLWADAIKDYQWIDQDLKLSLSNMHFLDVPLDLDSNFGCCQHLSEADVEKAASQGSNIVRGLQMSIKTLLSNDVGDVHKAIALRYLLHWMGDLHQPLHICSPTMKSANTYGGNLIVFRDPTAVYFETIIGGNVNKDLKKIYCRELHLSFDALLGIVNQLPEGINNSSFSPDGYTLWKTNMGSYMDYLGKLYEMLPKKVDTVTPNIVSWANSTRKEACCALMNRDIVAFDPSDNDMVCGIAGRDKLFVYITLKDKDAFLSANRVMLMSQISLGGQRLGKLLNAIFDSQKADSEYVRIVEEINRNASISILDVGDLNKKLDVVDLTVPSNKKVLTF